jgi:hypothetical protein
MLRKCFPPVSDKNTAVAELVRQSEGKPMIHREWFKVLRSVRQSIRLTVYELSAILTDITKGLLEIAAFWLFLYGIWVFLSKLK